MSQFRRRFAARVTPGALWMILIQVGVFIVTIFLDEPARARLVEWFVLTPEALFRGEVWKLATTVVFNVQAWPLFFNVLILWMFMPALEEWWGTRRFVMFLVYTSLVGNLAGSLLGLAIAPTQPIAGMTPFVYASLVAYGVLWSARPVHLFGVLPITGKALAIGVTCFVLLFVLLGQAWVEGAAYFSAMGLSFLMTSQAWTPNLWWLKYRRWRIRKRYKVIDGGKSDKGNDKRWMN